MVRTDEELQREEEDDDLWPGMLGVCVGIPTRFVVRSPDNHHSVRDRYEKAFVFKLDRVAKEFHSGLRAQIQDPSADPYGFYYRNVILWSEGDAAEEVDHNELRRWLHKKGYNVHYATYHYGPAMA